MIARGTTPLRDFRRGQRQGIEISRGEGVCWRGEPGPEPEAHLTFSSPGAFTVAIYGTPRWDGTVYWSRDGEVWAVWDGAAVSSAEENGVHCLRFRGSENTVFTDGNSLGRFVLTGSDDIRCDGNIESLLEWETVAAGNHPVMGDGCFNSLFSFCGQLVSAPELPAVTLTPACYDGMFSGCTSLVSAPELPAVALANYCYRYMFMSCTSLEAPPALPAVTLAKGCYRSMFSGCSSIRVSQTQGGDYQTPWRVPAVGTGTDPEGNGTLDMFAYTGGTFTGTPVINTTYYLAAD